MLLCDPGLLHDTWLITGTSGHDIQRPLAQEGRPSAFFNNSKNLASPSQELRPDITGTTKRSESELRREPYHFFQSGGGILNHIGGTCSRRGMIDYPRFPMSELHLGKFLDAMDFESWLERQLQN